MERALPARKIVSLWLLAVALAVLVCLSYVRIFGAGFIWDDDSHLTQNPCVIGPLGFKAIWTTAHAYYYPLVLTTFWFVHKFAGLNPMPYHALNVILHALSAILVWRVLKALDLRGAWLAAAIWAVHPVMVESVAWITELKNAQSGFFYWLSILFFLKFDATSASSRRRITLYALSLLFFAMAITSKTSTVMLPLVVLLCIWWRRQRIQTRDILRLAPYFLISALSAAWTIWEQQFHSHAIGREFVLSQLQRLIIAGDNFWFYFGKLIWPHPLIFIYPRWKIDIDHGSLPIVALLPFLLMAGILFELWWQRSTRLRPIFFAAAYFAVSLFPILGLFNVYFFRYSFVGDHFQYLASVGPLALIGAGIARLTDSFQNKERAGVLVGLPILAVLSFLTWQQTAAYRDTESLWRTTISQNAGCWMAYNNLGAIEIEKGSVNDAIVKYEHALALNPDYPEAHYNLGAALLQKRNIEEAIRHCETALRLQPNEPDAHVILGNALLTKGDVDLAIEHYRRALQVRPEDYNAHFNLGVALQQKGDAAEAAVEFETAQKLEPNQER